MKVSFLLSYAAPYRTALLLATLLMLLESATSLAIPWLGGSFAGYVLTLSAVPATSVLLSLLAVFALQAVLKFCNTDYLGRTAERISADLKIKVYEHLQSLPISYFQQRRHGDILALLTHEAEQLGEFISGTLLSILPLLITVCGAVVMMLRIDPLLALLVTALVPLFFLVLKVLGRRLRPLAIQLQEAWADVVAIADENFDMLPEIKVFTREIEEAQRYRAGILKVRQLAFRQLRINAVLQPALGFITAVAVVLLLWLASDRIAAQTMSPAELISFLLYAALLTSPVSGLAGVYGQVQMARGTLQRLQQVMQEKVEEERSGDRKLSRVEGAVTFENISFSYPGRASVLEAASLEINAGETIAIVGENGAGKSTLVHLMLRLHECQAGRILIDGIDIRTVSLRSLRQQIGLVAQHVLLFNGTVADNIGFARTGADRAAIEAAAMQAQAHDFIVALPQGYDTLIGDDGVRLSGGQRQRLSLARALLKDPPILILDEATAMFDPEGEQLLIERCHQLWSQRTVLLITHRPASLALADRIIKLHDGKLWPA